MCGIIGYIGKNCLNNLIDGLKNLEYRGYDSSGIAFFYNNNYQIIKSKGNIGKLSKKIDFNKYKNAYLGIGHTRWATHGKVESKNAHPFESNNVIIIHNGIIENYKELKLLLMKKGYKFKSEVDSEVIAHLIDYYYKKDNYLDAIANATKKLKGMYSILILFKDNNNHIFGCKKDSPLYIGESNKETIISSDLIGIIKYTKKYYQLNNEEIFMCNKNETNIYNYNLEKLNISFSISNYKKETISKDGYKHYMLKEIYQEETILESIKNTSLKHLKNCIKDINKIVIVGCGSAYNAGLIGKYLFTNLVKIKTQVEVANEFCYNPFLYDKDTLFIFISQSGETADTISSLRLVKSHKIKTLGIVNVVTSTIANECDYLINLNIGNEIAVASTKAYFAQVAYLYKLCFLIAKEKNIVLDQLEKHFNEFKLNIPRKDTSLLAIAKKISKKKNILYIGRSNDYNLSLEGSLKLKEITYIHSEAYQAGELKHGPISLIDNKSLVIALMSIDKLKEKMKSNVQEIISRKGKVILITHETIVGKNIYNLKIDSQNHDYLYPLSIIPILELLAYYCALYRKTNIDKPKNLAKSVTVE